jgi:hypothetical protein
MENQPFSRKIIFARAKVVDFHIYVSLLEGTHLYTSGMFKDFPARYLRYRYNNHLQSDQVGSSTFGGYKTPPNPISEIPRVD